MHFLEIIHKHTTKLGALKLSNTNSATKFITKTIYDVLLYLIMLYQVHKL